LESNNVAGLIFVLRLNQNDTAVLTVGLIEPERQSIFCNCWPEAELKSKATKTTAALRRRKYGILFQEISLFCSFMSALTEQFKGG